MEENYITDIERCVQVLSAGGLILYPTDTVWGIGCDATNPAAVKKIFDLKKRDDVKAMIVLVADERDILKYTASPDLRVFDYLQKIQKPTTVIYEQAVGLAQNLVPADGTIAIRITSDPFCRHLVRRFRKPVVSTSANLSGEPTPATFNEIAGDIKESVDYIVGYRQDDLRAATPSAVIKWNRDASVTIVRP